MTVIRLTSNLRWLSLIVTVGLLLAACGPTAETSPTPSGTPLQPLGSTPPPSFTGPTASPTASAIDTSVPSASPGPTATTAPLPSAPNFRKITYTMTDLPDGSTTVTTTVKWTKDNTPNTTVKIFGVNPCLANKVGGKCAKDGQDIPGQDRFALASAPASAGTVSWDYWMPAGVTYFCGALGVVANQGETAPKSKWYYAIVLRTLNANGGSSFVVADTTTNDTFTC
jgi:hypothetical protein